MANESPSILDEYLFASRVAKQQQQKKKTHKKFIFSLSSEIFLFLCAFSILYVCNPKYENEM